MSKFFTPAEDEELLQKVQERDAKLKHIEDQMKQFSRAFHLQEDTKNGLYENKNDGMDAAQRVDADHFKKIKNYDYIPEKSNLLGKMYYRDIFCQIGAEALFALTQGLPKEMLFSETPEAVKRKSELGEKFRKIFEQDPKLSPEERLAQDKEAGKVQADMNKYAVEHYDPAGMGDLSKDDVLIDHLFEAKYLNPGLLFSDMNTQKSSVRKSFLQNVGSYEEMPEEKKPEKPLTKAEEAARKHKEEEHIREQVNAFMEKPETKNPFFSLMSFAVDTSLRAYHTNLISQPGKFDIFMKGDLEQLSPTYASKVVLKDASQYKKGALPNLTQYDLGMLSSAGFEQSQYEKIMFSDLSGIDPVQKNKLQPMKTMLIKSVLSGDKQYVKYQENVIENPRTLDKGLVFDETAIDKDNKIRNGKISWNPEQAEKPDNDKVEMTYRGTDKSGKILDPNAMRDVYKNFGKGKAEFTDQQLTYSQDIYEHSLGKAFGRSEQMMLGEMGITPFDCIFINGKSVHQLYSERPGAEPNGQNFADMKAMVVAAGLYGANQITYAKPVVENGKIAFPKTEYLRRQNSKISGLEDQKGGFWHHNESMQDKFDRAYGDAKSRDKEIHKTDDFRSKLNSLFSDQSRYQSYKEAYDKIEARHKKPAESGTSVKSGDGRKIGLAELKGMEKKTSGNKKEEHSQKPAAKTAEADKKQKMKM